MFSHIVIGSNDLDASKAFYDATLGALGCPPAQVDGKGRLLYVHDGGRLVVTKPIDGAPACGANGGTIGFSASSPEAIDAWHKAGLAHGGVAIENPPVQNGWDFRSRTAPVQHGLRLQRSMCFFRGLLML